MENKRLKEELENSQEQQMVELKSKHDFIKEKYELMASSGSLLKFSQTQKISAFTQTEPSNRPKRSSRQTRNDPLRPNVSEQPKRLKSTDRYVMTNDNTRSHIDIESAEVWKLRCKLLAEKYFSMIKDMKQNLLTIKCDAIEQLQQAKKDFEERIFREVQ